MDWSNPWIGLDCIGLDHIGLLVIFNVILIVIAELVR